jgi:16S rRNA (cytosine967-C5)-methyltransferase
MDMDARPEDSPAEMTGRSLPALVQSFLDAHLSGERADRALAGVLRANPQLSSEERRAVAEWSLGIALWRGRLDILAQQDRLLWLPLFLVDRENRSVEDAAALSGVAPARLDQALQRRQTFRPDGAADELAFRRSFPGWLARRWIDQWGLERADALVSAMNERGPIAIRANTLRCDRVELRRVLEREGVEARPSEIAPHALRLHGRPNIQGLQAWRQGLFEVQDEGSQLVAEALSACPGDLVVDLCAGSGGKTLAIGAHMQNRGRLIAVDVDPQRLVDLRVRAARHRLTCIEARQSDATSLLMLQDLRGRADTVLVDAPCSSTGTFRRGPDARWRLQEADITSWSVIQRALLSVATALLRPGGRLVYATCSLEPAEDEEVVRTLDASTLRLREEHRTWPDEQGCDGFYWAIAEVPGQAEARLVDAHHVR